MSPTGPATRALVGDRGGSVIWHPCAPRPISNCSPTRARPTEWAGRTRRLPPRSPRRRGDGQRRPFDLDRAPRRPAPRRHARNRQRRSSDRASTGSARSARRPVVADRRRPPAERRASLRRTPTGRRRRCHAWRSVGSLPAVRPLESFVDADGATLLRAVIDQRCNVVVSGATSSGKTSLVAALLASVSPHRATRRGGGHHRTADRAPPRGSARSPTGARRRPPTDHRGRPGSNGVASATGSHRASAKCAATRCWRSSRR